VGFGDFLKETFIDPVIDPVGHIKNIKDDPFKTIFPAEHELAGVVKDNPLVTGILDPATAIQSLALQPEYFEGNRLDIADNLTGDVFDFNSTDEADAQAEIQKLLKESAESGIALNQQQLAVVEKLTQPFRDAGTQTALPNLQALAQGGDVDFQPSKLAGRQLEAGREGILKSRSGGSLKSSGTFSNFADLATRVSAEDVGRFEQDQLDLLRTGLKGEDILRGTSTQTAGNVGGIFSNLGRAQNLSLQQLAEQQKAGGETLSSGVQSLSQLAFL
jgi:hypothetical protein